MGKDSAPNPFSRMFNFEHSIPALPELVFCTDANSDSAAVT
jgi:hypothetical protein